MMILDKIVQKKKALESSSLVNGALFSLYSFINRGISFFLLLILANYITPSEYGYLSLWGTVISVIGFFIAMGADGYLGVSYFQEGEVGIKKTFSCIGATLLLMGCFFTSILKLFGDKLSVLLDLPISSLYLAVVISVFSVLNSINLDLFRIKERVKIYGVFSILNTILNFGLSILLVVGFMYGWYGRALAQTFCTALFGIIGLYIFIKGHYIEKPDILFWKKILIWGVPLIPHAASTFIRQGCDRYIINSFYTIDQVGLFSFALNMANIIIMVGLGFNQSNSVDIYKVLGNKSMPNKEKIQHLKRQRNTIGSVYAITTLVVLVLSYLIIPVVLPKYENFKNYFAILSVYAFFQCLYYLYTNFLFFFNRTRLIMYTTFFSSVLHLGLSLIFTRYSMFCTCAIYCLSHLLVFIIIRHYALIELKARLSNC